MYILSREEMMELERIAIEDMKIPAEILMENAAIGILKYVLEYIKCMENPLVTIIVGSGNNGGDGLALGRLLFARNINIEILQLGDKNKYKKESKINLKIIENLNISLNHIEDKKSLEKAKNIIKKSDILIDGIFGTGLNSDIRGVYKDIINIMNDSNKYIISIDIPSGLNTNTGKVMGTCVNADETITFAYPKFGNYIGDGKTYSGKIKVENISIPSKLAKGFKTTIYDEKNYKKDLPIRNIRSNKGSHGKVFIFAGSEKMPGANILSSMASYKTGAGIVKSFSVKDNGNLLINHMPEILIERLKDKNGYLYKDSYDEVKDEINKSSIILIGPGLGCNEDTQEFLENIIKNSTVSILIDGDGLNILSKNKELFKYMENRSIITPHPLEMARLTDLDTKDILENPYEIAREFSEKYKTVIALKDSATIVGEPNGNMYINISGNKGMAKGGSGDVLGGIIAGLVAQGLDLYTGTKLGVYIHGLAGDMGREELGDYGLMAMDITRYIPYVMK